MTKEEIKQGLDQIKGEKQEQLVEAVGEIEALKSGIAKIDEISVSVEQLEMDAYKRGQDSMVLPDPASGEKLYSQAEADQIALQSKEDGKAEMKLQMDAEVLAAVQAKDEALLHVASKDAELVAKQAELDALKLAHEEYKAANLAQAQS